METLYPVENLLEGKVAKDEAVTVLITRTLEVEEEEAFLKRLKELLDVFEKQPGTLGVKVFRRMKGGKVEVSIVKRYESEAAHRAWLASEEFQHWLREVAPNPSQQVRRYSGLEGLFVTAKAPDAPPRWKMAVVLMMAVFPLSLALSYWAAPTLASMSPLVGTLITTPIMVWVMTYVMVPVLTKVFAKWLHG